MRLLIDLPNVRLAKKKFDQTKNIILPGFGRCVMNHILKILLTKFSSFTVWTVRVQVYSCRIASLAIKIYQQQQQQEKINILIIQVLSLTWRETLLSGIPIYERFFSMYFFSSIFTSSSHNPCMKWSLAFNPILLEDFHRSYIKPFHFIFTGTSDCLLVLVCLLILAINQVFAKPFVSTDMSNAANIPSLDDTLRSPCRERSAPAEIQAQVNIRGILEIIGRQSGIARSIARKDVEEYVSILLP